MTVALAQDWHLSLLGVWRLRCGSNTVTVPSREQRLIACVGLLGCRHASFLAGLLWPKSSETQAAGNLRTTVWCISHAFPHLLCAGPDTLELDESVRVDVAALGVLPSNQLTKLVSAFRPHLGLVPGGM